MNLRPMSMSDADKMLEWKNYPETRQFAIVQQTMIEKEDHLEYLKENLQYFQIIYGLEDHGVHGAIRIKNNEISIWLGREYWGRRIATYILNLVSVKGMTAKIANGNIPSMRCFINAGFRPISFHNTYYIFQR